MEYLYIDWETYYSCLYNVGKKIIAHPKQPDIIVAIGRGGLTPGHILSDLLKLPVTSFGVVSYADIGKHTVPTVNFPLGKGLDGKHVLLVDDVSDSGGTFLFGIEYVKSLGASEVTSCALYTKPHTQYLPDYWINETDKWIIFPYELRECVQGIAKQLKAEGKTENDIHQFLLSLKVPEKYIQAFL